MIVIASQRTRCGCTSRVASVIDYLPGHPARRVQLRVSVGLLTDGASSVSAFPGANPSGMIEMDSPSTIAGAVSFRGQ
ncbi:hypothetical protein GCM10010869_06700 [Mesorhizobium tianshanense]|uniref:Uncharacterized protein n=1 Tax=Mesorhizobium tianshanense TaxID=39844 RepID=A0A562MAJ2_9HYPH|nr:hypothetical protein IQ26_07619 [Mesorhizobium tianshanense]GLS35082.1 hypothetical protein GCM10010869_06700 [Mesorhizobium tianshanense]